MCEFGKIKFKFINVVKDRVDVERDRVKATTSTGADQEVTVEQYLLYGRGKIEERAKFVKRWAKEWSASTKGNPVLSTRRFDRFVKDNKSTYRPVLRPTSCISEGSVYLFGGRHTELKQGQKIVVEGLFTRLPERTEVVRVKRVGDTSGRVHYIEHNELGTLVQKAERRTNPFIVKAFLKSARSYGVDCLEKGFQSFDYPTDPIDVFNEWIESGIVSRQELMEVVGDESMSDAMRLAASDALDFVDPAVE